MQEGAPRLTSEDTGDESCEVELIQLGPPTIANLVDGEEEDEENSTSHTDRQQSSHSIVLRLGGRVICNHRSQRVSYSHSYRHAVCNYSLTCRL